MNLQYFVLQFAYTTIKTRTCLYIHQTTQKRKGFDIVPGDYAEVTNDKVLLNGMKGKVIYCDIEDCGTKMCFLKLDDDFIVKGHSSDIRIDRKNVPYNWLTKIEK